MKVSFLQPTITEEDIEEVVRVLRSGWLVLGEETKKFEKGLAEYLGVSDVILTNSCACSLQMLFSLLGLKEGDEVITTPLSYVSTVSPALHHGAKPVFVDVEEKTGLITPEAVEAVITDKTKMILPVHLYGQMVDMKGMKEVADKHNLLLVEDAAHAVEAERDGVRSGALSHGGTFSFHVAKSIVTGTGGALAVNDPDLADKARVMRHDGVRNVGNVRRMEMLGYKYLATEFQASLLSNQLKRIDSQWARRKEIYEKYSKAFDEVGIKYNQVIPGSKHAYHMIVIWVDPSKRAEIREKLSVAGVGTSVHYDPIHLEPYYKDNFGFKEGDFPVAEKLGASTITLPMYPSLTDEEQDYVIGQVLGCVA